MALDWTHLYTAFKGLWVALEDDEVTVIASGKTLKETLATARNKGYAKPIMTRVPSELLPSIRRA